MRYLLLPSLLITSMACAQPEPPELESIDVAGPDGGPWLRHMVTPYVRRHRELTYKVFSHLLAFDAAEPITKGAGGKYPHHRGLFIGWKDTLVAGEDYDTWHMANCYQELASHAMDGDASVLNVDWKTRTGDPIISEVRTIRCSDADGIRVVDFESTLTAIMGDIELRGDLQHAGMQVRMAQEVVDNEDTTVYMLPEGATENDNDEVVGGWWACGHFTVGGKRYSVMHMTPPSHPEGEPVYSIRAYGRFGAFWEPDLAEGESKTWTFRVAYTEGELDRAACQALYDAYAATT